MSYSNFITPPDYIQTVLIIGATEDQIKECGDICQKSNQAYNVYFYNIEMNQPDWLERIQLKADITLDANSTNPADYFNK